MPLIEDAAEVLLLDAIDRGDPPGELVVLEREQVPRYLGLKLSPHQVDLREVLALAELRDRLPGKLVAIGLQPGRIEMFSGLSPEVEVSMDRLLSAVIKRLERWGHPAVPLGATRECMS